ncbi:hypothetical protein M9H77_17413 [Catharanthus roseus]|uniref:Uncharacterized protein n=1 Tax=Catharanthus roseus TaxID=4058 RepID=A0ACC0B4I9_CATRO|nr:hypothetical protein M9H77_17413 [Catharanthus roseus]
MVKVKNANIRKEENYKEGGSSRSGSTGKGKGKRVATETRKRKKIAPGHRVDLSDMEGMEIIPNLFEDISWEPLLTVNKLYYPEMIYGFYANLHKGRVQKEGNITYQWVTSKVGSRHISFDDRMLNTILGTPENGIRFYTKNKKCFDPKLYRERRLEELFTKGEVLKRHDDRNINHFNAYRRLLNHMISNIIIPNVGHKSSITNMYSFVMLALHEHRRMNFCFMAIKHMLATQTSSTKCLPYGCFLIKVFKYFVLNLVGFGGHIGIGKIYNKHTLKRIRFSSYEEGMLSDDEDEEEEDDEGQGAMNVDEEECEEEPEEETFRREMREKRRQERVEEGQSSGIMSQLMEMIASMQA